MSERRSVVLMQKKWLALTEATVWRSIIMNFSSQTHESPPFSRGSRFDLGKSKGDAVPVRYPP